MLLTTIGLALTTIGATWLAWIQIQERVKKRDTYSRMKRIQQEMEWHTDVLSKAVQSIEQINARFGAQAYDIESETASIREKIESAKNALKTLDDPGRKAKEAAAPVANQLWAMLLLATGFVVQLLARLL